MSLISPFLPISELPAKVFRRISKSRMFQLPLSPFGRELAPKRWIFIIGCYNSGTTLLNSILSSHPDIAGLSSEGVTLTSELPRPEEFGWTRMWCRCVENVRLMPGTGMAEKSLKIKKQWSLHYRSNAENLLDKSIANAARMGFLQEYFGPAYFIYIVRNAFAVAEGIRRKANLKRWKNPEYADRYPIELCAEQWKVSDEIVQEDRRLIDRFLQISYEDLTADPVETLSQITSFLGISPLDSNILKGDWHIQRVMSRITNMNYRSFDRLSESDIEKIFAVAGPALEKYGYLPPK